MKNKLDVALVDIFINRFVNRFDVIDYQDSFYVREKKKRIFMYRPVWLKKVDEEAARRRMRKIVLKHLNGRTTGITLGIPCLDLNNCSKFLWFDDDTDSDALDRLQAWLKAHGAHTIKEGRRFNHETGKWKAGHLIMLFDRPVQASVLRILANVIMQKAGVSIAEVFPKQDKLTDDRPLGSVVKLPLGIHQKPDAKGIRSWFDDCEIKELPAQLAWLASQPLNSSEAAIREAFKHRPIQSVFLKPSKRKYTSEEDEAVIDKETGFINFVNFAYAEGFSKSWDDTKPVPADKRKILTGPCPLCVEEGHDSDGNHFWVNVRNGNAGCWRCNDRFKEICRAIIKKP